MPVCTCDAAPAHLAVVRKGRVVFKVTTVPTALAWRAVLHGDIGVDKAALVLWDDHTLSLSDRQTAVLKNTSGDGGTLRPMAGCRVLGLL